jgi:Leucine Rich repeat
MSTSPPDANPSDADPHLPSTPPRLSGKKRRGPILAALLVVLLGTGAYFKWSAVHAESMTQTARTALAADGIAVLETAAEPDDAPSPFQSWETPKVVRVQSNTQRITDAELPKIAVISQDINLVLASCPITDDGLSRIAGKTNIRWLSLAKTAVDDDGMKHLRGMNLRSLDLSATKITDSGLAALGECDFPRLKEIAFEHTSITDAGLMHLANFRTLEWVSTAGTKITEDGRRHLKAKLPQVTILR